MPFPNPLLPSGADPWVVCHNGRYHLVETAGRDDPGVTVRSAATLAGLATARPVHVWHPESPAHASEIWAPEAHFIDGRWFIYVAADDGDNAHHRMHVLEGGPDPSDPYRWAGVIGTPDDHWAIDGTVLSHPNGRRYFIWSGWEGDRNIGQNLYIAEMTSPRTLEGPRVLLSRPDLPWERRGGPPYINEGPAVLVRNGRVMVVYSAAGSWSDNYCLGVLTIDAGADPLEPANWQKSPLPVFRGRPTAHGPGHPSFTTVRGSDWIVYHANEHPGSGWSGRSVRAQRFRWGPDGLPRFGSPRPVRRPENGDPGVWPLAG